MKASRRYVIGSNVRIPTKGIVIGDSIVAEHTGTNSITYYLFNSGDYAAGYDVVNQAVSGNTIEMQRSVFEADPNKLTYDWGIMQVGVNNLSSSNSIVDIINAYQGFVDYIKANTKPGFKLILSTLTPCKARLDAIGYSFSYWQQINQAITGGGSTPIANADGFCSIHTDLLNDGSGNLAEEFQGPLHDEIHPNNAAKELIATVSWKPKMQSIGMFTP